MAVVVSFMTPGAIGSISAPGIGQVRAMEVVTVPGTTTATVREGEVVMIGNAEATMILAAHGTTPDGQAVASTPATSAGYPIPAGGLWPVVPRAGDKINIKPIA